MLTDRQLKGVINTYMAEQRIDEGIWFYRHVESIIPNVIVEIGVKEGGNLKILSSHLNKGDLLIGIDQRKKESIPWKMDDARCQVRYIEGDSHSKETISQIVSILDGRLIDVLFIDGDHSYTGMLQDHADYSPFVRHGGIIAFHDIYYLEDVAKAWQSLEGRKFEFERNQSSIGIGFIIKD